MTLRKLISGYMTPTMRARAIRAEQIGRDKLAPAMKLLGYNRHLLEKALHCPQDVQIEVTSACDADCIMCPRRSISRRQGPMEFSLFRKIVDEAVEMGVPMLSLNGYGEISTLKNCREYLAYIRSRSRDIGISINTNGMRMTEQLARDYIDFRVNVVNITIDGASAGTFANT
jgi:MoaA/NifB/PqqE/SkfB family radical SAM enzyme